MLRWTGTVIGNITLVGEYNGQKFEKKVELQSGNELCVLLSVWDAPDEDGTMKTWCRPFDYYSDEKSALSRLKRGERLFAEEVKDISLNMFYKDNYKILKIFMAAGYKVTCYYEKK